MAAYLYRTGSAAIRRAEAAARVAPVRYPDDPMAEFDEPVTSAGDNDWAVGYLDILLVILTLLAVLLGMAYVRSETEEAAPPPQQITLLQELPVIDQPAAFDQAELLSAVRVLPEPVEPREVEREEPGRQEPAAETIPEPPPVAWPEGRFDWLERLVAENAEEHFELIMGTREIRLEVRDTILFASGSAEIGDRGREVLQQLAAGLRAEDLSLSIEGHTDNRPIRTPLFPSNWELSSYRATTVARFLIDRGIPDRRIHVSGYADTRPVAPNDTPHNRARNRRVSIVLQAPEPRTTGQVSAVGAVTATATDTRRYAL